MKNFLLKYTPIFLGAFFFYAMVDTAHSRAIGDLIFEAIGIPAWTDGYQGLHISIFVFLVFIFVTYFIRDKFVQDELIIRGKQQFWLFVVFVTIMYFAHSNIVQYQLGKSDNLESIVLQEECIYSYSYNDGKLTEFNMEFELTNYSSDKREFEVVLEVSAFDHMNLQFDSDAKMIYELKGNETRLFQIDLKNEAISVETKIDSAQFGGNGRSDYVILKDNNADEYIIRIMNQIGVLVNRN